MRRITDYIKENLPLIAAVILIILGTLHWRSNRTIDKLSTYHLHPDGPVDSIAFNIYTIYRGDKIIFASQKDSIIQSMRKQNGPYGVRIEDMPWQVLIQIQEVQPYYIDNDPYLAINDGEYFIDPLHDSAVYEVMYSEYFHRHIRDKANEQMDWLLKEWDLHEETLEEFSARQPEGYVDYWEMLRVNNEIARSYGVFGFEMGEAPPPPGGPPE